LDPVSWVGLVLILVLTGVSALLVLAENSALELSQTALDTLDSTEPRAARRLRILLDNRFRFWASARIGAAVLIFASAALAATTVGEQLGTLLGTRPGGVVLALAVLSVLHAGGARVTPRILAQRHPVRIARRFWWLIYGQYILFLPASLPFERLLSPTEQEAWRGPDRQDAAVIEAVEGAREGAIDDTDIEMITNVIELGDRFVRQVMTPRPDIVAVNAETTLRGALRTAHAHGLSRLPVFEGNLDNMIGIIHVRDGLAELLEPNQATDLRSLVREPLFIPDSKYVDRLLREMQADKLHMAIVVNEYGDTAGLVTIEDLLEEIVGEIEDEYDVPDVPIVPLGPGRLVVDAGLPITDLNDELDLTLTADGVDTVGGLAFSAFGRVPAVGESVNVNGAVLRVHAVKETRITRLEVTRLDEDGNAA
jgi:putative hemolysin